MCGSIYPLVSIAGLDVCEECFEGLSLYRDNPGHQPCHVCGTVTVLADMTEGGLCVCRSCSALLYKGWQENPSKYPGRAAQIVIPLGQKDEILVMNGWIKDILYIALKQYPEKSDDPKDIDYRRMVQGMIDNLDAINALLEKKFEMKAKALRAGSSGAKTILLSVGESVLYYSVLDIAESAYGRYIRPWFLTKEKREWPAWRERMYSAAWHLGHLVRHGNPAPGVSPWILREREPMDDDPFGSTPLGQEGTVVL
jgi:hypothetical protein